MPIRVFPPDRLEFLGRCYRCAIGRAGVTVKKKEGDGATPAGAFPIRRLLYRPDRLERPMTRLAVARIRPEDGWCDDPAHPLYNRPVTLPFAAGHEIMWREDHLYDLVLVLGHNDSPPEPGKGSAIFMHVAGPGYPPTAGCVALSLPDLLEILAGCGPESIVQISP